MARRLENEISESSNAFEFAVVGGKIVGEKAGQLWRKSERLQSMGWHIPKRIVLAQEFLGANGTLVRGGSLTAEQFETLKTVCARFEEQYLVVRSSAEGDARGTGTYKSVFVVNSAAEVRMGVEEVLASYFSESAAAFRRDARTGEGMGIMIEPLIGQNIEKYIVAPVVSGFGYSSTLWGEGYVGVVPGLGGGVESHATERITRSKFESRGETLASYIYHERSEMFSDERAPRMSALLQTDGESLWSDYFHGLAYFPPSEYSGGKVNQAAFSYDEQTREALRGLDLRELFSMAERMEAEFGVPQYYEWALTFENGRPVYWIIQIADVDKKVDFIDFGDLGHVLFIGHTVTGSGVVEADKIVTCWNPDDMGSLYKFNQSHKDYVLMYSSRLVSRRLGGGSLSYADFGNAAVFLEIQDARHLGNPVAHLGGQLEMARKLFGVLDYDAEIPPDWKTLHERERSIDGIKIFEGKVKVIASERQNRLVVSLDE